MKRKTKIFLLSLCLLFLIVGGITTLTTSVAPIETVFADENNEIKIISIKPVDVKGTTENISTSIYNNNHTVGFETSFADIGDYIEYKVTVKNEAPADAYLTDVKKNLSKDESNGSVDIMVNGYTKGQVIKSGETIDLIVKVECLYSPVNTKDIYLNVKAEITLSFETFENEQPRYLVSYNCELNTKKECKEFNEYKNVNSVIFPTKSGDDTNIPHIRGYKFLGWADASGNILTDSNGILLSGKENITVTDSNIDIIGLFEKKEPPTIESINTSSFTTSSITAVVNASTTDDKQIAYYEFKIDNGKYINIGNTPTYTFMGLKSDMNYTITVKVCDNEGLCTEKSTTDEVSYNKIKDNIVTENDGLYIDKTIQDRYIYKGSNPNNYVKLGDTLYRIISLEPDGTFLIVSTKSLGNMPYDSGNRNSRINTDYCYNTESTGCNIFGNSLSIINTKNNEYINTIQLNGTKYTLPANNSLINIALNNWYDNLDDNIKSLVQKHKFNIGYVSISKNQTLAKDTTKTQKYQWEGYAGLISVIDYANANSNENCNNIYESTQDTCATANWMPSSWLITPYSSSTSEQYSIKNNKITHESVSASNEAYPVIYLNSSVTFTGSGTSDDPYIPSTTSGSGAKTSKITKPSFEFDKTDESKITITYEYKEDSTNPKNNYEYIYRLNDINDSYYAYDKTQNKFIKYEKDIQDGNFYPNNNVTIPATVSENILTVSLNLKDAGDKVVAEIKNVTNISSYGVSNTIIYTPLTTIKSYSGDNSSSDFKSSDYINKISTVTFDTYFNKNDYINEAIKVWDISEKQNNSVIAILTSADETTDTYNLIISGYVNNVQANTDSSYLFSGMINLTSINFASSFDTSNVTNMSNMFAGTKENPLSMLSSISGIEEFDTSNVTDMSNMFAYTNNISALTLTNFDTSNVKNFSGMFAGCSSLQTIDVSSFDTNKATNIDKMFKDNSSLQKVNGLEKFNTENVTTMNSLFSGCTNLQTLNLCNFDTKNVTENTSIFKDTTSLKNIYVSSDWTIETTTEMFDNSNIKDVTKSNIETCNIDADGILLSAKTEITDHTLIVTIDASANSKISKYSYKLSIDDAYQDLKGNTFTINNLSSGKYTLYIKVYTGYGNEKEITKDIEI